MFCHLRTGSRLAWSLAPTTITCPFCITDMSSQSMVKRPEVALFDLDKCQPDVGNAHLLIPELLANTPSHD